MMVEQGQAVKEEENNIVNDALEMYVMAKRTKNKVEKKKDVGQGLIKRDMFEWFGVNRKDSAAVGSYSNVILLE